MKNLMFSLSLTFFLLAGMFSVFSQSLPRWGVVYGLDVNLSDANYEIMRFNGKKVDLIQYRSKAVLLLRNNKYRSVLQFNTEKEAKQALTRVEDYLTQIDRQTVTKDPNWTRGSFVVNLSAWCPKWSFNQVLNSENKNIRLYKCQL